jgi:hypothetical protein
MTTPGPNPSIGSITVSGGQASFFGSGESFVQYNLASAGDALDEVRRLVEELRRHLDQFQDPEAAGAQVRVLEGELARPDPARKATVQGALVQLTALTAAGMAVMEFLTRAQELVNAFWPF